MGDAIWMGLAPKPYPSCATATAVGHFTTITVTGLDKAHTSQPCPGNSLHTPLDPKDGAPCPVGEGVEWGRASQSMWES